MSAATGCDGERSGSKPGPITAAQREEETVTKIATTKVRLRLAGALLVLFGLPALLVHASSGTLAQQQPNPNVRPPAGAIVPSDPSQVDPTQARNYDAEMWRQIRRSVEGTVSIPDTKLGRLVDSSGEEWRNFRNGPLPTYGAWAMGGIVALLALFFLVRGPIRIEHGWSGRMIERFSGFERMGHWLLATSFIILALTGLNVLYGRYVLTPVIGKEAFATIAQIGKTLHNYVALAFMIALVWVFIPWVRHNLPHWRDLHWLAKGGGFFTKGLHPPAWKFNAGQKIIFWLVILCGISISMSGLSLLFPYQMPLCAKTFAVLNALFGLGLPESLTPNEEMQYAASWHGIVALFFVVLIIAHIYIGTLGMEGAFSAMGTGQVDVNWAKEHHSLWAEEVLRARAREPSAQPQPAE
jgi:formate dehydrogenase subunit gamma